MYVRIHGDLKSFNNRKSVNATSLKKVTDHNEVQYHLLETVFVHLYHTRGPVSCACTAIHSMSGLLSALSTDSRRLVAAVAKQLTACNAVNSNSREMVQIHTR